jgi:hypothetical protein
MFETFTGTLPDGDRVLFLLPTIRDEWPAAVKDALAIRRRATLEGRCPRCGATWRLPTREERRRAVRERRLLHVVMEHEHNCPAGDKVLRELFREVPR